MNTVDRRRDYRFTLCPFRNNTVRAYVFAVYHLEEDEEKKRRIDVCMCVTLIHAVKMTKHM